MSPSATHPENGIPSERSPLLPTQDSHASRSDTAGSDDGEKKEGATVTQAVFMLLKAFIGTGVLFLGRAYYNGGILFSNLLLAGVCLISLYSFQLLVKTHQKVPGSFGDMGGELYGKWMRWAILFSITISQLGFVTAYLIFVAENLRAFTLAVTNCHTDLPIRFFIFIQLVVFAPLALLRKIQKLSSTSLIANAFIAFSLLFIFGSEISILAHEGIADVELFNTEKFPLMIGTAVFAFEGVGLILPITEAMQEPEKFPKVMGWTLVGIMLLLGVAGSMAYAAFGSAIQPVVILNLPQNNRLVNTVQLLFSLAIMLSLPLQLFPAVRIIETGVFEDKSGKVSTTVKWEKNSTRALLVIACMFVAWVGASDLDKFVSLIGSVACVPLCFVYPAMLHYKANAVTRKQKAADIALAIFGVVAAIYTTTQTIIMLAAGDQSTTTLATCKPSS